MRKWFILDSQHPLNTQRLLLGVCFVASSPVRVMKNAVDLEFLPCVILTSTWPWLLVLPYRAGPPSDLGPVDHTRTENV